MKVVLTQIEYNSRMRLCVVEIVPPRKTQIDE